ncbi:serine/threonine-protein phosphatase 6 regulatory subunit [Anaeramoeba flamelloides]|uniref:Serine/threonine-protein phosphatase 6 regulatory subunit n=1 Tax=Anaeramoeba flamelloides TaxID=1746091 RepID=A0AAV7ZNU6_9EUKA|nr:serine/threonine-protein phosphatase 6 regulatory subunit [Anaeramoeba flamelloides]
MFWRFNYSLKSKIDEIFEKENFTLQDLFEEEDLIQECRYGNELLIEYLTKPEIVKQILQYLLVEPTGENIDEKEKFKYPYFSNEIIGLELFGIVDVISSDTELMDFIFSFLDNKQPLNCVYAGYFSRCISVQLKKRRGETLNYLKSKPEIIDKLCLHLKIAAIKDFMISLLLGSGNTEYLEESNDLIISTKLIPKLINLLSKEQPREVHDNVTRCFLDFFYNESSNPILYQELGNKEICEKLLSCILDTTENKSLIENVLSIMIELLIYSHHNKKENIDEKINPLLELIYNNFPNFAKLLDSPTNTKPINLAFGNLKVPVGQLRLKAIQLFHILYHISPEKIKNMYCEHQILHKILDLFFEYKWNTFLHNYIRDMINLVLEGASAKLFENVIIDYNLIPKMIKICHQYEESKTNREYRRGNFTHIFQICNKLVTLSGKDTTLNDKLNETEGWNQLVDGFLADINKVQSQKIGEMKNDLHIYSEESSFNQNNLGENDDDFFDDSDENSDEDDDFDIFDDFDDEIIVKDDDSDDSDETPSWLAESNSLAFDNNYILRKSIYGQKSGSKKNNHENSSSTSSENESEDDEEEKMKNENENQNENVNQNENENENENEEKDKNIDQQINEEFIEEKINENNQDNEQNKSEVILENGNQEKDNDKDNEQELIEEKQTENEDNEIIIEEPIKKIEENTPKENLLNRNKKLVSEN